MKNIILGKSCYAGGGEIQFMRDQIDAGWDLMCHQSDYSLFDYLNSEEKVPSTMYKIAQREKESAPQPPKRANSKQLLKIT